MDSGVALTPCNEGLYSIVGEYDLKYYMNNLTPSNTPMGPTPTPSRRPSVVHIMPPDCPLKDASSLGGEGDIASLLHGLDVAGKLPVCFIRKIMNEDGETSVEETSQQNKDQISGPHVIGHHSMSASSHNLNAIGAAFASEPLDKIPIHCEATCKHLACQYNRDNFQTHIASNNPYYGEFRCNNPYHQAQLNDEFGSKNEFHTGIQEDHPRVIHATQETASTRTEISMIRTIKSDHNNGQTAVQTFTCQNEDGGLVAFRQLSGSEVDAHGNTRIREGEVLAKKKAFAPLEELVNLQIKGKRSTKNSGSANNAVLHNTKSA